MAKTFFPDKTFFLAFSCSGSNDLNSKNKNIRGNKIKMGLEEKHFI
jgi:hypothetical protein